MIEDQNTGKFFKDAFDGYDSPFDADKMFANIESEIEEEKKPKRRIGWYLFGCGGLLFSIGLAFSLTYLLNGGQKLMVGESGSTEYPADVVDVTEESKRVVELEKNKIIAIEKLGAEGDQDLEKELTSVHDKSPTIDLERTEESVASVQTFAKVNDGNYKHIVKMGSNSNQEEVRKSSVEKANGQILNLVGLAEEAKEWNSEYAVSAIDEKLTTENRILNFVNYLDLYEQNKLLLEDRAIETALVLPSKQQRLNSEQKWSIAIGAAYLWTDKKTVYSGIENPEWYKNFVASERLHPSYKVGIDVNYLLTKHIYLTSSISFLHAQESHETNIVETESIFDEELPQTIYVDRDGDPFDTIFGADFMRTTSYDYYLVTNIRLMGHGIGAGYCIYLAPRLSLSTDVQFIYYLMQSTEGMMVNPDGLLVDNTALKLDGQSINLNKSVFGGQARFTIEYRINESFKVGISSLYRHHFGDFSDSKIFSQKRNYFGLGVRSSYSF